jgi:hypothetical protein
MKPTNSLDEWNALLGEAQGLEHSIINQPVDTDECDTPDDWKRLAAWADEGARKLNRLAEVALKIAGHPETTGTEEE